MKPDFDKAKKIAQELIESNFITSPPIPVNEIAASLGVDIKYVDFGEKYSDIAGYIKIIEEKKVIYINENDVVNRQTFTIAHELGHLILHKAELQKKPDISILLRLPIGLNETDPLEKEANCFAANLLVPKNLLEDECNKNRDTKSLADIFKVSRDVIGFRLKFEYGYNN